jgi:hypothetical protein
MKYVLCALMALGLAGCAAQKTVRQQDIDAWAGVSSEALDLHSFFITIPMFRTMTESGVEVRNYANTKGVSSCSGSAGASKQGGWINGSAFSSCVSETSGCNNVFYIKGGRVVDYAPVGNCWTDESIQPEPRFRRMTAR